MFSLVDFVVFGISGLIDAFEKGLEVQGKVLNEAWGDLEEYEIDSYYENFEDAGRWDIGRAFIYQFTEDGKYYRIWRTVSLTEMQETYFEDQTPQVVEAKSRVVLFWD